MEHTDMTLREGFANIRVPRALRRHFKRLAAAREVPMYKLLEEWVILEEKSQNAILQEPGITYGQHS